MKKIFCFLNCGIADKLKMIVYLNELKKVLKCEIFIDDRFDFEVDITNSSYNFLTLFKPHFEFEKIETINTSIFFDFDIEKLNFNERCEKILDKPIDFLSDNIIICSSNPIGEMIFLNRESQMIDKIIRARISNYTNQLIQCCDTDIIEKYGEKFDKINNEKKIIERNGFHLRFRGGSFYNKYKKDIEKSIKLIQMLDEKNKEKIFISYDNEFLFKKYNILEIFKSSDILILDHIRSQVEELEIEWWCKINNCYVNMESEAIFDALCLSQCSYFFPFFESGYSKILIPFLQQKIRI